MQKIRKNVYAVKIIGVEAEKKPPHGRRGRGRGSAHDAMGEPVCPARWVRGTPTPSDVPANFPAAHRPKQKNDLYVCKDGSQRANDDSGKRNGSRHGSEHIKKGTAPGGGRCLDSGEVSIYQFLRKYMDSLLEPL